MPTDKRKKKENKNKKKSTKKKSPLKYLGQIFMHLFMVKGIFSARKDLNRQQYNIFYKSSSLLPHGKT